MIININYENVDNLEAAKNMWANVLEAKIITESIGNQTQKYVLEIIEESSYDNTNLMGGPYISETEENIYINFNTYNSIIAIKSIYNNSSIKHKNNNTHNNLAEITNFLFLIL